MRDQYDDLIQTLARENLPRFDWLRIKAQALAESQMSFTAISPAGAIGIMQIMPGTGKDLGYSEEDLRDPEKNITAGTRYMAQMLRFWEKIRDPEEKWNFALASYNSGPGNIRKARYKAANRGYETDWWSAVSPHLADVTGKHARETINYVARCRSIYSRLNKEAK